jgi:hypothetical protein
MLSICTDPFLEIDSDRDKIASLEEKLAKQQKVINTLVESVGLLMRIQNGRFDIEKPKLD